VPQVKILDRPTVAALVAATLGALPAAAVDITVSVPSATRIKPFFRSNCWVSDMPQTGEWIDFGSIPMNSQLVWEQFETLMRAKCSRPYLDLSYTLPGEPAYAASNPRRIVNINPTRVTGVVTVKLKGK